ncbi:MAG: 30S ribosomal protein S6 [Planctomycetales bacterium]|nr:30S ribosomal protein S6 [Planctomycetales bacterium]
MSAVAENPVRQHFYEGMFLVDSGKFATDADAVTNDIMSVLAKAGATVVAHRPWQDGKLAYEIQGMKKGLHYIVCFTMRGAGMKTLIRQCQLNETIIRQMFIVHSQQIFDATVGAITGAVTSPPESQSNERPERGRNDRRRDEMPVDDDE